jgi:hypothetical protein
MTVETVFVAAYLAPEAFTASDAARRARQGRAATLARYVATRRADEADARAYRARQAAPLTRAYLDTVPDGMTLAQARRLALA